MDEHAQRHLRVGWWSLALFASLGLLIEALHAFKAPFLVDAGSEITRMLLRLGHAHGTLLALVNLIFAVMPAPRPHLASRALLLAQVLVPGGFLLGAIGARGGDPGAGVVLVPLGALALIAAAVLAARHVQSPAE